MFMYHCKVVIASDMLEIMSFNLFQMAWLLTSGWLPVSTPCLPGALI